MLMDELQDIFKKYNQYDLFEESRMKILLLKESYENDKEFYILIEETLLVGKQEGKTRISQEDFFKTFMKIRDELRDDEAFEFFNS